MFSPYSLIGLPTAFTIRRNVLRHARAAADEAVPADRRELVHRDETRQNRLLVDRHVAGELRPVRDDHAVADVAVVREVHVRHEEAVLPDRRLERLRRAAIDRRVFANRRAVADLDGRVLALVLEILRIAAEHRARRRPSRSAPSVTLRSSVARGAIDAAVADRAALADDRERADLDAVAELRRRDG